MAKEDPHWDDSLLPAKDPESIGEIELTEEHWAYGHKRWKDAGLTERAMAYRLRQAIWARIQHQKPHPDDPGRRALGGPQPGAGRKANKEIGKALVEAARERQKEVVDAIFSALDPANPNTWERHRAGMNIVKHERDMAKEEREADLYARQTDEEVRLEFAKMLAGMVARGEISLEQIKNGQVAVNSTAEEISSELTT